MNTITTTTLSCGLPVIVESIPGVKSVGLCWMLPVGTATEPEQLQGHATMLSELIFRGAGELDSRQQADALDRLGLSRGSTVGGYYLHLTATMLGDRVQGALPLLVDMVRRPKFEESAIEPTRDLSLQALHGLKDNPQERASVLLSQRHNPPPLNRSSLGTEEGLAAITRESLLAHWSRCVRPRGAILALAGAVEAAPVVKRLEELLKGWEGTAPAVEMRESATRGSYHHEQDESNQVQIFLAHGAPAEKDADCLLERMVASVLSGGSSSRLFTEVREKRALCYSVSASYSADKHWGRVTGYVGTTPDKAQESLDVMVAEMRKINGRAGEKVLAEEFQRTVVRYKSGLIFSGESTGARAASLATDQHRLGRARSLTEMAERVDKVRLDDVNDYLARRTLGPMTIVTLGPKALVPPK